MLLPPPGYWVAELLGTQGWPGVSQWIVQSGPAPWHSVEFSVASFVQLSPPVVCFPAVLPKMMGPHHLEILHIINTHNGVDTNSHLISYVHFLLGKWRASSFQLLSSSEKLKSIQEQDHTLEYTQFYRHFFKLVRSLRHQKTYIIYQTQWHLWSRKRSNTVCKEIFGPVLISPSLSAGKFKTGRIQVSNFIL